MSKAFKHIDWCLKKSEKEIKECKRLGKRPKHRGLLKINPNIEEAKNHLAKAEHYLSVTEYLVKGKFSDISVGTIFYTMYQCFLSIASKFGYDSGNQSCTISLVEFLKEQGKINIDERFLKYFMYEDEEIDSIIELRENYTYGTNIEADKSKTDFFIKECKELIDITKEIIYSEELNKSKK